MVAKTMAAVGWYSRPVIVVEVWCVRELGVEVGVWDGDGGLRLGWCWDVWMLDVQERLWAP